MALMDQEREKVGTELSTPFALGQAQATVEVPPLPKLEFERFLLADASVMVTARERAKAIHHGKDIDAAGHEVETAGSKCHRRQVASTVLRRPRSCGRPGVEAESADRRGPRR